MLKKIIVFLVLLLVQVPYIAEGSNVTRMSANKYVADNFNQSSMMMDASNSRHAKAIDLGKKYLWDEIKKQFNGAEKKAGAKKAGAKKSGKRNPQVFRKSYSSSWVIGSVSLAFFALLRADEDPTDPEMEKYLLKLCELAKKAGYTKTGEKVDRCGYVAGCLLMMIEAALNNNDTDGSLVKKTQDKTVRQVFRGSKKLQSELLSLAEICVRMLNAEGDRYGKAKSKMRGHMWGYDGSRGFKGERSSGHHSFAHRSTAQYAVLGLRCAKLIGVNVANNVWEDIHKGAIEDFKTIEEACKKFKSAGGGVTYQMKALESILKASKKSLLDMEFDEGIIKKGYKIKKNGVGLWPYYGDVSGYGYVSFNMVCAALGNLAMAYSFMPDKANSRMRDKIAMGLNFCQLTLDDLYDNLSYYDYYSWERVAVFYGVKTVKGKNWHHDMSEKICDAQNMSTGEFVSNFRIAKDYSIEHPLLPTAYAVLFLKKATKKLRYTVG